MPVVFNARNTKPRLIAAILLCTPLMLTGCQILDPGGGVMRNTNSVTIKSAKSAETKTASTGAAGGDSSVSVADANALANTNAGTGSASNAVTYSATPTESTSGIGQSAATAQNIRNATAISTTSIAPKATEAHETSTVVAATLATTESGGVQTLTVTTDELSKFTMSTSTLTKPVSVDVSNANGSVQIREVPSLERAEVFVYQIDDKTKRGAPSSFVGTLNGSMLTIFCGEESGRIQIEINVPSLQDCTIRNAGGTINVSGAAGVVDITNGSSTRQGDGITFTTNDVLASNFSIGTDRGSIALNIPSGSQGLVTIRGQPSRVSVLAPYETLSSVRLGEGTYSGVLNGGDTMFRVSAPGPVALRFN